MSDVSNKPLAEQSLISLSKALTESQITSVQITEACLESVEQQNTSLNAITSVQTEAALKAAQDSDTRRAGGQALGPLDGIPFGFKANILVEGYADHAGIRGRKSSVAPNDSHAISKLKAAGLIPFAQTNMDEGALGITGRNDYFGDTINPLNSQFSPGGSSSGTAAALAANMMPAALGSDSLGSIRIPASLCGIVGLKPSRNLVRTLGTIPLSWTFDHVGPMTRSVDDTFMMLSALLGIPASADKLPNDIKGMKIGVPYDFIPNCPALSDEVFHNFETAVQKLKDLGALIQPMNFRNYDIDIARKAAFEICEIEMAEFHGAMYHETPDAFSERFKGMIEWGMKAGDNIKLKAMTAIARMGDSVDEAMMPLDAIITPTTPVSTFGASEQAPKGMYDYTAPANFAGMPAISIPFGLSSENAMPFGLQIMGNILSERKIITIARMLEGLNPTRSI
ncbi:amidase [Kordiimonas sp. SCSIO 12610]|uniref:amidase n=1 Tax=Kordiimonas sp. SCSIO 12610 TaxID=2829597 RepID=UPI00210BA65E|nr:amidase [Kordiimonas sp. SCSIO 12610]UTW56477.1 amidase [Kordiimonas sp. SCSIO 12610]